MITAGSRQVEVRALGKMPYPLKIPTALSPINNRAEPVTQVQSGKDQEEKF
jgi:hypothetical protein